MKISFSSYSQYSRCGEQFRLRRIDKVELPERPASWTVFGNAYHKAVELYELGRREQEIEGLFRDAWDLEMLDAIDTQPDFEMWDRAPRTKNVQTELDTKFSNGLEYVANYAKRADRESEEWHLALKDGEPLAELPFEVELKVDGQDVLMRGYIDQVRSWNGQLVAVDLKTGSPSNTDHRQLGLYCWAAGRVLGEKIPFGRFFYSKLDEVPRSGDKMGKYSDWYQAEAYDDEYWYEQIAEMIRGVDNRVFLPNVSELCNRCDVKPACRAFPTVGN